MSWQDEVDELNRQEQLAREMGGKEGIDFQHGRGKLTVRERIDLLADENSFHEVGTLTGTAEWDGDELKELKPVRTGNSELWAAMKMVSETQKGPKEQIPSMGCNIKWVK